jgi:hypothetical protein
LTEVYKLPKDRLYVTYFEGDPKNGLAPDEEARQVWLNLGVAEDHILTGSGKDNIWGALYCSSYYYLSDLVRRNGRKGRNWSLWSLHVSIHID